MRFPGADVGFLAATRQEFMAFLSMVKPADANTKPARNAFERRKNEITSSPDLKPTFSTSSYCRTAIT